MAAAAAAAAVAVTTSIHQSLSGGVGGDAVVSGDALIKQSNSSSRMIE